MATVYHRDQPGAPVWQGGATNSVVHFNALKAILIGCLVDGYGGIPAAGWELIDEGASHIVLRNGTHSGYLNFARVSAGTFDAYVGYTFLGMSGAVMTGDGVRSGIAANNSAIHRFSGYLTLGSSEANGTWHMVADEKTFVLSTFGWSSAINMNQVFNNTISQTFYGGEDSAGNFICAGGALAPGNGQALVANLAGGFTALRDPGTGLLLNSSAISVARPSIEFSSSGYTFSRVLEEVQLVPISWRSNEHKAGNFRGCAITTELYGCFTSYAANCLGFSGVLNLRNANTPLNLGDGHTYFSRGGWQTSGFFLTTDNPDFW